MYTWLGEVGNELRGHLVVLYWILLPLYTVFLIVLEQAKLDGAPNIPNIMKRVIISIILLLSFDECIHAISVLGDGISEEIGGFSSIKQVFNIISKRNAARDFGWMKFKDYLIFIISFCSYIIAYLGVFVSEALINFVWVILYIVSPLMILMYVSEKTAFITTNLYKSLISVMAWKVFWSILAVLLLKMIVTNQSDDPGNFLTTIVINLFIACSMLFVPFATKSLLSDGLSSSGSSLAGATAGFVTGGASSFIKNRGKAGMLKMGGGISNMKESMTKKFINSRKEKNNEMGLQNIYKKANQPETKGRHFGKRGKWYDKRPN